MISIQKWLKESLTLSRRLIVQQIVPLSALFIFSALLILTAEDFNAAAEGASSDNSRMMMQLVLGIWDLVEGVLTILILSWGIPQIRELNAASLLKRPFAQSYFGSFLAEYFRVLAQVLLWGLMLIIPGFIRYVHLIFVPLITLFSKDYREGQVDALALSRDLVTNRFGKILAAIFIPMLLEAGCGYLPEALPDLHNYPVRLLCLAATFYFSVLTYSLIFVQFEEAMESYVPAPATPEEK